MSNLRITTSDIQEASGKARLSKYHFSRNKSRKIISFEYDDAATGLTSFGLTLVQGSTSSAFSLIPSGATFTLSPGQKLAVAVDYDYDNGTGTTASLYCTLPIGASGNSSFRLIGPTCAINFQKDVISQFASRNIGSRLAVDDTGDYQVKQRFDKIDETQTSFGILRCNPKLSGNIKITVDSETNIWLNTLDATKELADDKFKKYRIYPNSSFAIDIKRFLDNGNVPSELVYYLHQKDEKYDSTKRNFSDQYDDFYRYGIEYLNNKHYDEDYSFLAPLYLGETVPDYFVIFRTNGPFNEFSYNSNFEDFSANVSSEIIANSTIIKTFSLKETSNIGKYLRNIVNHPSREKSDLTVSFQKSGYTTFNGISYKNGSFAQKGELLFDFYNEENPLIVTDEFLTLGFQRNKMLSSHVFNLEFLFDDPQAETYEINRYFGLYVNALDLVKFQLDSIPLKLYSSSIDQLPLPRSGDGTNISLKDFTQTNETGIRLFLDKSKSERVFDEDSSKMFSSIPISATSSGLTFSISLNGDFSYKINQGDFIHFVSITGSTGSATSSSIIYENDLTKINFLSSTLNSTETVSSIISGLTNFTVNFDSSIGYLKYTDLVFDKTSINESNRFFYVKDKLDNLHTVLDTNTIYYNSPTASNIIEGRELVLGDISVNVSSFAGFDKMLTQTEGTVLDSKGYASIEFKIDKILLPNDWIEISWNVGSTSSEYPTRWRAVANSTNLQPDEIWPTYGTASDSDGLYYISYFHPGDSTVNEIQVAKNISRALNIFEFKNYEILQKDETIIIKSTQEGLISESAQIKFNFYNSETISIMNVVAGLTGSCNFIGGSNRNRNRFAIDSETAIGVLTDEWIATKGSFSLPKTYEILGETITYSSYVDEPVYDSDGILTDFYDSENKKTISLLSQTQEIQITHDQKITSYELFKPTFGILSVLPLKDYDFDFYDSDYTKNYTPELSRYFSRYTSPLTIVSATGASYTDFTFDKGITFSSYPIEVAYAVLSSDGSSGPVVHNYDSRLIFYGTGNTASLLTTPNASILSTGDQILILEGNRSLYISETDLTKFNGFTSLSKVVSTLDDSNFGKMENLLDPRRFVTQLLNSEYGRLLENFLKTQVLKSRVVPYVTKWVSDGKDVRDNQYRFNYHRSFGNMNFSPSVELDGSDPKYHTHEWPYIDRIPNDYSSDYFSEHTFSYMFTPFDESVYDLSSLDKDWFSEYFETGYPTELYIDSTGVTASANIENSSKFSEFKFEEFSGKTYTFFRGQRLEIKDFDSDTGEEIINSEKYNNYKFSSLITIKEENLASDPVSYELIINEKWKFILLKITVRLGGYKYIDSNIGYIDLYTLQNDNDIADYQYETGYSSLVNYSKSVPVDKQLSKPLNLENYGDIAGSFDIYNLISNYNTDLSSEILPNSTTGIFHTISAFYVLDTLDASLKMGLVSDPTKTSAYFSQGFGYLNYSSIPVSIKIYLPYSIVNWTEYEFYHESGGNNSYLDIKSRISFFEISKTLEEKSDLQNISYNVYKEDGSTEITSTFSFSFVSPEKIERIFEYVPIDDEDKPSELFSYSTIGSKLILQQNNQTIHRYQGNFNPKFRDVLKFWLRENDRFTSITSVDFLMNNTHLNLELENSNVIKNQFFNKVSDKEILKISKNSGYSSVYPFVDEISIDKKNEFVWSSSWDKNFYRKYYDTSNYTSESGTSEMKELKTYLGSKAMKVPKKLDLYEFVPFENTSSTEQSMRALINQEFVYHENLNNAKIQVNVYERLLRELSGNSTDLRASTSFLATYAIPNSLFGTTTNKRIREYLEKNIMNLYQIDEVFLYVLNTGNAGVPVRKFIEINSDGTTLNASDLSTKNYLTKKDIKMTQLGNMIFEIDYDLDSRLYTSLSLGVTIKRI